MPATGWVPTDTPAPGRVMGEAGMFMELVLSPHRAGFLNRQLYEMGQVLSTALLMLLIYSARTCEGSQALTGMEQSQHLALQP